MTCRHAGIDPLGVVAGQALLGNHVRLDVDELEREPDLGPAFQGRDRLGALREVSKVVFIDVDADVQPLAVAQNDHRLLPGEGGDTGRAAR